ncbi:hypothetical protein GUJ93_ZPchr0009g1198 [Zizania palustris]|uniref:Uncharacterized protein n=1 Tax=Zizania palustris TaxID=103762 RepID=A0A8J5RKZ2_ZIZPA|nr:hypothetical protein GUJ93_ZPchr0009g1198 [Zizania palustris]
MPNPSRPCGFPCRHQHRHRPRSATTATPTLDLPFVCPVPQPQPSSNPSRSRFLTTTLVAVLPAPSASSSSRSQAEGRVRGCGVADGAFVASDRIAIDVVGGVASATANGIQVHAGGWCLRLPPLHLRQPHPLLLRRRPTALPLSSLPSPRLTTIYSHFAANFFAPVGRSPCLPPPGNPFDMNYHESRAHLIPLVWSFPSLWIAGWSQPCCFHGGELQRKGRTLWAVIKEKDEELAFFLEMRHQEKERGVVAAAAEQLMRSGDGVYAAAEGKLLVDPSLISSWEPMLLQSVLT